MILIAKPIRLGIFRSFNAELNKQWNLSYQRTKRKYLRIQIWPVECSVCNFPVRKKSATIDHVVPRWLCYFFGVPSLVLDWTNFQVLHSLCNNQKGGKISENGLEILAKLVEKGQIGVKSY